MSHQTSGDQNPKNTSQEGSQQDLKSYLNKEYGNSKSRPQNTRPNGSR